MKKVFSVRCETNRLLTKLELICVSGIFGTVVKDKLKIN